MYVLFVQVRAPVELASVIDGVLDLTGLEQDYMTATQAPTSFPADPSHCTFESHRDEFFRKLCVLLVSTSELCLNGSPPRLFEEDDRSPNGGGGVQYVQYHKWLTTQMATFVGAVEKVDRDEQVRCASNGLVRTEMMCSTRQFDAARQYYNRIKKGESQGKVSRQVMHVSETVLK